MTRIAILVGYMIAISFVPDIKRVFMYHGAEHKTVYCNEAGLELTPLVDGTLTRRECAELLYQLSTLCQQDVLENFRWDS